jgi:hypothetical protein
VTHSAHTVSCACAGMPVCPLCRAFVLLLGARLPITAPCVLHLLGRISPRPLPPRGEPSPGADVAEASPVAADVAGVSPVAVQMWHGWPRRRGRCGSGVSPVPPCGASGRYPPVSEVSPARLWVPTKSGGLRWLATTHYVAQAAAVIVIVFSTLLQYMKRCSPVLCASACHRHRRTRTHARVTMPALAGQQRSSLFRFRPCGARPWYC